MKKFTFTFSRFLETAIVGVLLVMAGCSFNAIGDGDFTPILDHKIVVGTSISAIVDLGTAGDYAVLAKTGVSTTGSTEVTGNVGVSPADQTYLTGFSETMDATNVYSLSIYVTGKLYAADYEIPTPANLSTAISDMETAYTTAAGLTTPDEIDLGAGEIGGLTLVPGLYKWGTGVGITTDVTISGSDTDTWVFQIAGDLTVASGASVILSGGALPENITWQVGSSVSLGTGSHVEGVILAMTAITMDTGATLNGRALAQSAVTMDANTVTEPSATTGITK